MSQLGVLLLLLPQAQAPAAPSTFTQVQANIIGPKCLACHNGPAGIAELDLSTYDSILSHQLVKPGDPADSDLYIQVNLGAMPEGGPKLADTDIAAIFAWIEAGAPND